jgi:hypothetical protein
VPRLTDRCAGKRDTLNRSRRLSIWVGGLGALATAFGAQVGAAQPATAPASATAANAGSAPPAPPSSPTPAPVLVAPKLQSSPVLEAPPDTVLAEPITVVLRVRVLPSGEPLDATVESGPEPWSSRALARLREFRFSPATRDGVPIPAVVRIAVRFQSITVPALEGPGQAEGEALAEPAKKPAISEVTVLGNRSAPAAVTLTRGEVRELPGAFGDPFRAIEALPGVTPIVSGLPFFYIRGAPPGNVGYFLDGIPVPSLFHIALGPSVIHPGMVDHVDLHPGGYPARFGRFGGGIVAGESAPPRKDFHGEANIRLFDAGALVESGFANGKGSALIGGRYSYTARMLSLFAKDTIADYRDGQVRIAYDLTPRDQLSVFGFGSYDLLAENPNDQLHVIYGSEFYRADFRYDHSFREGSTIRQAVTLGFDRTRIADGQIAENRNVGTRTELNHRVDRHLLVRAGADIRSQTYSTGLAPRADPEDADVVEYLRRYGSRTDLNLGARADLVWTPHPDLEVVPGLRVDLFRSAGDSAIGIDPRLAGRVQATEKTKLIVAMGMAHQTPSFVAPVAGLQRAGLGGGLQRSFQQSFGVERDLPADTTLRITAYANAFFNLSDAIGNQSANNQHFDSEFDRFDQRALGASRGLELFLHRKLTRKVGGFVSYTLGRSTRSIGREHFPATFDRTHVLNVVLSFDLGRRWRAGGRFVGYTGVPDQHRGRDGGSPVPDGVPTTSTASNATSREPGFYRLDVRLEKRWRLGENGTISFVAEMLNATLHKEIVSGEPIGPVSIPSIGAEAFF